MPDYGSAYCALCNAPLGVNDKKNLLYQWLNDYVIWKHTEKYNYYDVNTGDYTIPTIINKCIEEDGLTNRVYDTVSKCYVCCIVKENSTHLVLHTICLNYLQKMKLDIYEAVSFCFEKRIETFKTISGQVNCQDNQEYIYNKLNIIHWWYNPKINGKNRKRFLEWQKKKKRKKRKRFISFLSFLYSFYF